jgi:hypothetical protein
MTERDGMTPRSFRLVTCPHCGASVPDAAFCGACGGRLAGTVGRGAATRWDAYAAFPDHPVLRLAVVETLLPQLSHRSRAAYRVAFGFVVVVLVTMAVAGLQAPLIAVSAIAVPLLFLLYLFEIEPLISGVVIPLAAMFVAGAALGAGWALVAGPIVADALLPGYGIPLTTSGVLVSAVAIPVSLQLLMVAPVAVARLWRPARSEALGGFTAGAASALGLTMAATLTELAPLLRSGNFVTGSSVITTLTEAVIRGLSVPLIAAAATGSIGAALWLRRGSGSAAKGRWLASPVPALAFALAVQVGLGLADVATLPDVTLLAVHLAAAAAALLWLRIGLHHVLMHEHREVRTGPARVCPNCHRVVPAMPFCPACGVAERATALNPLPLAGLRTGGDGPAGGTGPRPAGGKPGRAAAMRGPASGVAVATRPEAPPSDSQAFALADQSELAGLRQLGHRIVLGVLVAGLALLTVVLVVLALVLPAAPAKPCISLRCFVPFGPVPVHLPHVYTSAAGWTVQWWPADEVFSGDPPQTTARASASQLTLDFASSVSPAENGALSFAGLPARGLSASEIVTRLQQGNAPNAVPDYTLPGASVGYQPGYGEAFQTSPSSANGNPVSFEVVITCAVRSDYAICAYAAGPRADLNRIVNHPTPAKLALSLWTDPDLNGVRWKGQALP